MKTFLATACLLLAFLFALAPFAPAIEPTQWQYRQPIDITHPGPLRISLPLDTIGRAQPDLRDLRILAPDGTELPYAILEVPTERPPYKIPGVTLTPRAFSATIDYDKTVILIDTGTNKPIDSVQLDIADTTDYTKPARVEVSDDKQHWTLVAKGVPLFRRGRGEYAFGQTAIPLDARPQRHIRITISNQSAADSPIAIRGAKLLTADAEIAARAGIPDETTPVTITSEKQDAGTTILTLNLGTPNLSLSQLRFDIADTLFTRRVTITTPPLDAETAKNIFTGVTEDFADKQPRQVLRTGDGNSLYCIKDVDGTPMTSNTTLDFGGRPVPTRTIEARIINNDSPPLHIRNVTAKRRPVLIAFNPPVAGRYTLLSGNAQAPAPRYDLAAFSQNLGRPPVTQLTASSIEPTPDYRPPVPPPTGAPLNLATRALFWIALALVVILLLVVVAKLLPKPKE